MDFIETIKKNKLRCGCLVFLVLLTFCVSCFAISLYGIRAGILNQFPYIELSYEKLGDIQTVVVNETAFINTDKVIDVSAMTGLSNDTELPEFITYDANNLNIKARKGDSGEYYLKFFAKAIPTIYVITVKNTDVNMDALNGDLARYLQNKGITDKYGIYVKDLNRDVTTGINGSVEFPPASMAKMTMALLVMRDIDAGKYTLDSTYPLQAKYIFNPEDDLGKLGAGTPVKIRTYLERLLKDSNNTAWYHLDQFLGKSYESVNPRTVNELGVNPLFLNPHQGTAIGLGKLFGDLYSATSVSPESRDYIIDLLKNALSWNREGIGLGLPKDVQFANKIGNLWTENDVNFCDSAIVYGKNTDYILIIMNKDIDWVSGKKNLAELSKIVYSYLDK